MLLFYITESWVLVFFFEQWTWAGVRHLTQYGGHWSKVAALPVSLVTLLLPPPSHPTGSWGVSTTFMIMQMSMILVRVRKKSWSGWKSTHLVEWSGIFQSSAHILYVHMQSGLAIKTSLCLSLLTSKHDMNIRWHESWRKLLHDSSFISIYQYRLTSDTCSSHIPSPSPQLSSFAVWIAQ